MPCASLLAVAGTVLAASPPADRVDFGRDVQPIFKAHCVGCHGPKRQQGGFRLDRRHDALRGGTAVVIAPGNSEASPLYHRLAGDTHGPQMPPDGPLSAEQVRTIRTWIDQGAVWPDELAEETPAAPADPTATRLAGLLRAGDRDGFRRLLLAERAAARRTGADGTSPLLAAVLHGDAETVQLLLDAGADPNARTPAGATTLMWAADDPDKTRLLLQRGADPNAKSDDRRTALLAATAGNPSPEVVRLLLDHGADPSVTVPTYRGPASPLRSAAEAGSEAVVRLLLDHGADATGETGALALAAALNAKAPGCAELLFPRADRAAMKSVFLALVPPAGVFGGIADPAAVRRLAAAGADVNARDPAGRTVLMLAANSDEVPAETIQALLELGADVTARTPDGMTALDFARRRGRTPVVDLLMKAGATVGREPAPATQAPKPARSAREAVGRSLPLLQNADISFTRKAGCVSCHNNTLTAEAIVAARTAGVAVNEPAADTQRLAAADFLDSWRERLLQGMGMPGEDVTAASLLAGLAAGRHPADPATDAAAHYLKRSQQPDGRWRHIANRPPLESSDIELTALGMRALQVYAPPARRAEYEEAIRRSAGWVRAATPRTTTDHAFRLFGLAWAGADRASIKAAARDLLAGQRPDGGWGQLPTLASDALATGHALAALHESGALTSDAPAYRRGVAYLQSTQLGDGSWHVRSRSIPIQPYLESGFPHGPDQWVSMAATNWAVRGLAPVSGPVDRTAPGLMPADSRNR